MNNIQALLYLICASAAYGYTYFKVFNKGDKDE